jgi:hypothetical protein
MAFRASPLLKTTNRRPFQTLNSIRKFPIEPVLFLCMLCVMAEYSLVQHLVNVQLCTQYLNITDSIEVARLCDRNQSDEVKENVAPKQLQAMRNYNLLLFVFPLLTTTMGASWSDTFGRRLTMLIPTFGSLLVQFVLFVCSKALATSNILYPIWCCAAISGLTGTSGVVIVSCHGYVCERVAAARLTRRMTMLEAGMFVGGFVGFNMTARMLQTLDLQQQFVCGFSSLAVLHLLNIVYISFGVQEPNFQGRGSFQELFKLDHLKQVWVTISKQRPSGINGQSFSLLYFCSFLSSCALSVQTFLLFVYVRDSPFNWSASAYSYYSGVGFLVNGISLILIFPLFHRLVKHCVTANPTLLQTTHDRSTIESSDCTQVAWRSNRSLIQIDLILCIFGLVSKFAGLVMLGFALNTPMLFSVQALLILNEFAMPSFRSIISKLVDKEEKGKALSIISLLQNCSFFFGSIVFHFVYKHTYSFYPGFTFHLVAAMQLLAIFMLT